MKKQTAIIAIVIVALICFYGGMKYGESSATKAAGGGQAASGAPGGAGTRRGAIAQSGGVANGSILSVDANGITLKLRDGTSKIILLSASTPIMKSTAGAMSDLTVGEQVMVAGTQNTDGSITAQTVQIRPAGSVSGLPGGASQGTGTTQGQ